MERFLWSFVRCSFNFVTGFLVLLHMYSPPFLLCDGGGVTAIVTMSMRWVG